MRMMRGLAMDKPLLTVDEQINKMEEKGITFNLCSKDDAKEFLENHNNFFRITSYRKNYDKFPKGKNEGKYRYLDFKYLQEISTIDMHLRYMIIKMCLDIEHCLKLDLLKKAEGCDDGFECINKFLKEKSSENIKKDIYYKRKSKYSQDLINAYFKFDDEKETVIEYSKCRIWVLLEVLSFGQFVNFYNYFHKFYNIKNKYSANINTVRSLRNACAHNNCVLANLKVDKSCKPNGNVSRFVSKIPGVGGEERKRNLSRRPLMEFVTLLFVYNIFVNDSLKKHRLNELKDLVNGRMKRNSDYFSEQQTIVSAYKFLQKIVDFL